MTFDEAKKISNGNNGNTYFIFSERRDTEKVLTTFVKMATLAENGISPEKAELVTNEGRIIFLKGTNLEKEWKEEFSTMNVDVFKEEPKIIF